MLSNVDLPEPEGPRSATISFFMISMSTPRSTGSGVPPSW
jgi:hypothetical protein